MGGNKRFREPDCLSSGRSAVSSGLSDCLSVSKDVCMYVMGKDDSMFLKICNHSFGTLPRGASPKVQLDKGEAEHHCVCHTHPKALPHAVESQDCLGLESAFQCYRRTLWDAWVR